MKRMRQLVAVAVNIPILYKTGILSRYKVSQLLNVNEKTTPLQSPPYLYGAARVFT